MAMKSHLPEMVAKRKWSSFDLAYHAKIAERTADKLMKGDANISPKILEKLCILFEVQPGDILTMGTEKK